MKKSLLALAVLGAFAGAASAQTNVTIYGIADAGLTYTKTDADNSKTWGLGSGIQSGSRIGFKGTEDLGGGLKANFQLENGFTIDDGKLGDTTTNALFNRQAWVGVSGAFGAVKLGKQYNPIFTAVDAIDPFGTGLAGDLSNIFFVGTNDIRTNNTINYSYSASGFSGEIAYALGEVPGNTSANRQWGLGLGYANGPVNVQFAYHNAKDVTGNGVIKATMIGGTYDFGVAKLHAGFDTQKEENAAGVTTGDARDWMLGVSAPVAGGTVLASYVKQDDRSAANDDNHQWALGYTYPLSKRTNLYTSYSDRNVAELGGARVTGLKKFNAGIRHTF